MRLFNCECVDQVGNSRYYNYTLSVNGRPEEHGDDPATDYLTSVIWDRAKAFLHSLDARDSYKEEKGVGKAPQPRAPFFMMLSTPSCHAPFTPQLKYSTNFSELQIPRTKNFNIKNDNSKHWLLRQGEQPLSSEVVDRLDEVYRNRLRTLLTVDDMIEDLVTLLEKKEWLDNTYIIFTSDNGFHLGQFSLPIDKREPYEFDIRVPYIIRGPGIAEGVTVHQPTINVDLAPTILDLAGVQVPQYMDGISLKPLLSDDLPVNISDTRALDDDDDASNSEVGNHVNVGAEFYSRFMLVEHSGESYPEQVGACAGLGPGLYGCAEQYDCKCSDAGNNTYACVRHLNVTSTPLKQQGQPIVLNNTVFCLWQDDENFIEFYDLVQDRYQLHNKISDISYSLKEFYMDMLNNLTSCAGKTCNRY